MELVAVSWPEGCVLFEEIPVFLDYDEKPIGLRGNES